MSIYVLLLMVGGWGLVVVVADKDTRSNGELVIVSYREKHEWSPRGIRTRFLSSRLAEDWDVSVIGGPNPPDWTNRVVQHGALMYRLRNLSRWFLVDRFESWSWRRFRKWRPTADAAFLIGLPLSPLAAAVRRLLAAGVPYVLDLGDLSVVGNPEPIERGVGRVRTRRVEESLIRHARGIIVTTDHQRAAIRKLAKDTPILVRPNGYEPLPSVRPSVPPSTRILRMIHIGALDEIRVRLSAFINSLAADGTWDTVVFTQLGRVADGFLEQIPPGVEAQLMDPRPLHDALDLIADNDVAVVVDNKHGLSVPSKARQYLVFDVPKLAVVDSLESELAMFASRFPGWKTVAWNDPGAASAVQELLIDSSTKPSWEPPVSESWEAVSDEIAAFLKSVLSA